MVILGHGSDLTLAPTLRPVVAAGDGKVRSALSQLSSAGFQAVQLDAALSGLRPRDLDRRARKDLLALLQRLSLRPAGLDLFIPRKHFLEPAHQDRAVGAALAAVELAADLGRLPLSLPLPAHKLVDEVRRTLLEAADGHGVPLAVHCEDHLDDLLKWVTDAGLPQFGVALDPAAALARGQDPATTVQRVSPHLLVGRLADLLVEGDDEDDAGAIGTRCALGEGRLDVAGLRLSLDLCPRRLGPVVLDLRGVVNPLAAAQRAQQVWDDHAFTA